MALSLEMLDKIKEQNRTVIDHFHSEMHGELNVPKRVLAVISYAAIDLSTSDPDHLIASRSAELYKKYFHTDLCSGMNDLITDPRGYAQKVEEYEKECAYPVEFFSTETEHFKIIIKDPVRAIEKPIVSKALLLSKHINRPDLMVLDVGSGSGRISRAIEQTLKELFDGRNVFNVFGLDLSEDNINGAKIIGGGLDSNVKYIFGDMNKMPFPSESFHFVSSATTTYLNTTHRRLLEIAEMIRVLTEEDGIVIITGPNETFQLKECCKAMVRGGFKRYLDPDRLSGSLPMGKFVRYLEKLAEIRPDVAFPSREDMARTMKDVLGADILFKYDWPITGEAGFYSAASFSVNSKTKKAMTKYIDFRESRSKLEKWRMPEFLSTGGFNPQVQL